METVKAVRQRRSPLPFTLQTLIPSRGKEALKETIRSSSRRCVLRISSRRARNSGLLLYSWRVPNLFAPLGSNGTAVLDESFDWLRGDVADVEGLADCVGLVNDEDVPARRPLEVHHPRLVADGADDVGLEFGTDTGDFSGVVHAVTANNRRPRSRPNRS
jgi:hypothetical protein